MKKSQPETRAKILYLISESRVDNASQPSEVARSLFSETWRSYMDEVNMVSLKMDKDGTMKVASSKKEVQMDDSKGPLRLY